MSGDLSATGFWAVTPGSTDAAIIAAPVQPDTPTLIAGDSAAIVQEQPMAKYLTIPVADGVDLSNARVHDGAALSALENGTDYVCYRLSEASAGFTPAAEETLQIGAAQTISITLNDETYDLTLPGGTSVLKVNGTSYSFDTADIIGKAPLILGAPNAIGALPTTTATVNYMPAPFLYDPAGGKPEIVLRTVRDGVVLSEGRSHVLSALDLVAGVSVQQDAVNAYGVSTIETELLAPRSYAAPALVFSGSQALVKETGIKADGADNLLIAMNLSGFVRNSTNQILFYSYDTRNSASAVLPRAGEGNIGRLTLLRTGGSPIINFKVLIPGTCAPTASDQLLILIHARIDGTSSFATYLNGTTVATGTEKLASGVALSTATAWYFGGNATTTGLSAHVRDFRIWTDIANPESIDATARATRGNFIHADGTAKDPEIANLAYGTPKLWMPLDASRANALTNLGSGGSFTSVRGEFA